jgi:hypothetical protein
MYQENDFYEGLVHCVAPFGEDMLGLVHCVAGGHAFFTWDEKVGFSNIDNEAKMNLILNLSRL